MHWEAMGCVASRNQSAYEGWVQAEAPKKSVLCLPSDPFLALS